MSPDGVLCKSFRGGLRVRGSGGAAFDVAADARCRHPSASVKADWYRRIPRSHRS